MKNASWIAAELDIPGRPFPSFGQSHELCVKHVLLTEGTLADQVCRIEIGSVTLEELVARVVGPEVGIWFHGNWHDGAYLGLSPVIKGDVRALRKCFELLDSNPAYENGDMAVGFASLQMDWVLFITVSRYRNRVTGAIRAVDVKTMTELVQRLNSS